MSEHEHWEECPEGILTGMTEELRRNKRRPNRVAPVLGGLVLLLFSLAAGYLWTSGVLTGSTPELTCDEVAPLLAQYHHQTLDATQAQQVEQHLSICPHCKEKYNESFPEEARRRELPVDPLVAMSLLSR